VGDDGDIADLFHDRMKDREDDFRVALRQRALVQGTRKRTGGLCACAHDSTELPTARAWGRRVRYLETRITARLCRTLILKTVVRCERQNALPN
jgi:hypothetical protein